MSFHLLPCSCGQHVTISTSQAGQTVTCVCGARLEVPTLRDVRALAPAESSGRVSGRVPWEVRHRTAFVLALISLCALALGGFLAMRLPPPIPQPTIEQYNEAIQAGSPAQVLGLYEELKKGLVAHREMPLGDGPRNVMLIGVEVAVGIGACGLIAALALVLAGRKRPE